jgi:thiamine-phosphate pyrophosphorylase
LTLPEPPILVITDRRMAARPLPGVIESALQGGCRWVLLREPDLGTDALTDLGLEIASLCQTHGVRLSVSADLDAATAIGAHGLHLPHRLASAEFAAKARARLGTDALIGVSCHSRAEADTAASFKADYITMSPVFLTESKPGYGPALETEGLQTLVRQTELPVLGLSGIEPENASQVRTAGAAGIAVMGSVMRAANPDAVLTSLIRAWAE